MIRFFATAAAACVLSAPVMAQDMGGTMSADSTEILSLTMDTKDGGTAIIADGLGDKYVCEVSERRAYAEIRGCKPLRLSARVGGYMDAQGKLLGLFERNDCSLTYAQLKSALSKTSDETRKSVGEIMDDMTKSGALVDDEAKGSARLTAGAVCSK